MAKKKPKRKKKLAGVRIPLPRQTGGKHKDKTKYDRKRKEYDLATILTPPVNLFDTWDM